jgi:hypothetical protein
MIWFVILFAIAWPLYKRDELIHKNWPSQLAGNYRRSNFEGYFLVGCVVVMLCLFGLEAAGITWPQAVIQAARTLGGALGIRYHLEALTLASEPFYVLARTAGLVMGLAASAVWVLHALPTLKIIEWHGRKLIPYVVGTGLFFFVIGLHSWYSAPALNAKVGWFWARLLAGDLISVGCLGLLAGCTQAVILKLNGALND